VNVLRRTRRKPSTIRGAAPDVVIGQSTAARAGAHPYRAGEVARSYHSTVHTNDSTLTRNKDLLVSPLLELFLDRSELLFRSNGQREYCCDYQ
jgi:DNA-binding transcriptional ArsR family regulator